MDLIGNSAFISKNKTTKIQKKILIALNYSVMSLLAAFFLFPFWVMAVASFKPEKQIFIDLKSVIWAFIPRDFSLDNYFYIFTRIPFSIYLKNTLIIIIFTIVLGLIVNSMIAYSLSRLRWKGKNVILGSILAMTIVPLETIVVPLMMVSNNLPWFDGSTSWLDSLHVQIIPFICDAFSIYLFYQSFIQIPKDFDEAASMDGANPFVIYFRIIMPLARSTFVAVAIIQLIFLWSAYLWPLMVTRTDAYRPLTLGITYLYNMDIRWGPILAYATLSNLPSVLLFIVFQKGFIKSITSGSVKG
jgi:multiple sugar transport system permease protein